MRPNHYGHDDDRSNKCHIPYGAIPHYLDNHNFRQSSTPQRTTQNLRTYAASRQSPGPTHQNHEQDNGNGQTRRRIPVACARCRKRKIRCSGDPGNGSGCHNCRSAGVDINACQFHRVNSIECPMSIQYDISQAELTVKDVSHQYKNYLHPQDTIKGKDYIGHPDERLGLPSTKFLPQHSALQPGIFQSEQPSASHYTSTASQALERGTNTDIYSKHLDSSRNWNAEYTPGHVSDVTMSDQGTTDIYGQNSYHYNQSHHQQQSRQPLLKADNATSLGITALDSYIPPTLMDRQLPIPTGGRIVGSTTSSEMIPNQSSTLLSHGFSGIHFDHNVAYGRATSMWNNKNDINHSHCNSPGNMISHNLTNSSLMSEGETCDDAELSPLSCVSAQCPPESCYSSSTYSVSTSASIPISLARRELSGQADTLASKHGVPPSLYSFSSEYPRQGPCFQHSLQGSLSS